MFIESSFSLIFIDIMFSFDDQSFHDQNIFIIVITVFSVFFVFVSDRIIRSKSRVAGRCGDTDGVSVRCGVHFFDTDGVHDTVGVFT